MHQANANTRTLEEVKTIHMYTTNNHDVFKQYYDKFGLMRITDTVQYDIHSTYMLISKLHGH